MKREIWSVLMLDAKYGGNRETFHGLARNAGDAEKKALAMIKKDAAWGKPYIASVTFVGPVEF